MPMLARGWAPLRGVLVGREKYIDLPIAELYDLAATRASSRTSRAGASRIVTPVLRNVLRGFNVAPPNQPGEETAAARERLRALGYTGGSPAPARDRYTEADDPKRLIDLDKMLHRASELFAAGRAADAVADLPAESSLGGRTPPTRTATWRSCSGRPAGRARRSRRSKLAIRNGVKQRDILVKLGTYLAETGAAARAVALLETLPQDDTEALNALGIAYGHAGRAADAMRVFTLALELDATNGLAHQNIGTLHLRAGDLAAAEASLRKAIAIDPSLPGAYTALGVVLVKTGRRRRRDRRVEARGRSRGHRIRRALQPHHRARGRRAPGRGAPVRRALHRHGAGRRFMHRTSPASKDAQTNRKTGLRWWKAARNIERQRRRQRGRTFPQFRPVPFLLVASLAARRRKPNGRSSGPASAWSGWTSASWTKPARPIPDIRQDEVDRRRRRAAARRCSSSRSPVASGPTSRRPRRTITADVSTNQGAPQGQLFVLVFDQDHIRSGGEQPVRDGRRCVSARARPPAGSRRDLRTAWSRVRRSRSPATSRPRASSSSLVRGGARPPGERRRDRHDRLRGVRDPRGATSWCCRAYHDGQAAESGGRRRRQRPDRRFAEDPAVLRRLIRENAQSIVHAAPMPTRAGSFRDCADLLRGFRGIDGRKTVVLFSEGFYGDNVARELEDVAAAAAETYSVIYAFDLNRRADLIGRGELRPPMTRWKFRIGSSRSAGSPPKRAARWSRTRHTRLDAAFATLLPDDGSYYLLGFEPASPDAGQPVPAREGAGHAAGRARDLAHGLRGRRAADGRADRRRAIDAALAAPFTQQGLQVEYTTYVGQSMTGAAARRRQSRRRAARAPRRCGGTGRRGTTGRRRVRRARQPHRPRRGERQRARSRCRSTPKAASQPAHTVARGIRPARRRLHHAVRRPRAGRHRRQRGPAVHGACARRASMSPPATCFSSPGEPLPVRTRGYTESALTGTSRVYAPTADKLQ